MISSAVDDVIRVDTYCEACWRIARDAAGPIMSEGPIHWGESWAEVEEWFERSLRAIVRRRSPATWRRLIAADLQRPMWHLPGEVPRTIQDFLREFGGAAG
jgi:hypothetical protein